MRAHNKERSDSSVEFNRTDDSECSCPTSVFVFFHSFSESHILINKSGEHVTVNILTDADSSALLARTYM
jgi:hypothetical protein